MKSLLNEQTLLPLGLVITFLIFSFSLGKVFNRVEAVENNQGAQVQRVDEYLKLMQEMNVRLGRVEGLLERRLPQSR